MRVETAGGAETAFGVARALEGVDLGPYCRCFFAAGSPFSSAGASNARRPPKEGGPPAGLSRADKGGREVVLPSALSCAGAAAVEGGGCADEEDDVGGLSAPQLIRGEGYDVACSVAACGARPASG